MTIHLKSVNSSRAAELSNETSGSAGRSRRGGIRRDSVSSTASFDPAAGYVFKRSKIGQALIDVLCVLAAFALIGATAGSIVVSLFLLLFASF